MSGCVGALECCDAAVCVGVQSVWGMAHVMSVPSMRPAQHVRGSARPDLYVSRSQGLPWPRAGLLSGAEAGAAAAEAAQEGRSGRRWYCGGICGLQLRCLQAGIWH